MARGDNYQSFYPTKNLTLLDAKVDNQTVGYLKMVCGQQFHLMVENLP